MNPEFTRNVWLELTPRRIAFMVGILGLIFFAVIVAGGTEYSLFPVAQWLYYLLAVFLGTRNAALAVVGEMRDRTWDLQRLSAIGPGAMTWGKLFGSTIYAWFGALICLAVMLLSKFAHDGAAAALMDLFYYLLVGVIAQAAALLASLVAAARRQSHSRLEVYIYQVIGLVAASLVYFVWTIADPEGSLLRGKISTDTGVWWGVTFEARGFLLASLAVFTGWTLLACYREMRLELKLRNGPWVWLAWLIFIGIYVSGFDAWLGQNNSLTKWDFVALRLALGTTTFIVLTYLMVLLEPKDRVLYRWLAGQLGSGRIGSAFASLQAWMMSYAAALLLSAVLIYWVGRHEGPTLQDQLLLLAGLGFFSRDIGLFVLMQTLPGRRRGDMAALGALLALYVLIPAILNGIGLKAALPFFYPGVTTPMWLGAAVAWAQAIVVVVITAGRLAISERAAPATA